MGRYKELNQNSEPGQYLRSATIGEITCLLAGMNDDQLHNMHTYAVDEYREPNHEAEALEAVVQLSRKYRKRDGGEETKHDDRQDVSKPGICSKSGCREATKYDAPQGVSQSHSFSKSSCSKSNCSKSNCSKSNCREDE